MGLLMHICIARVGAYDAYMPTGLSLPVVGLLGPLPEAIPLARRRLMWVQVACPRCYLSRSINGIGRCVCGALLIYRPSARRKSITIEGITAYRWWPDNEGTELVHPDNGTKVTEERGRWLPCVGPTVEFPHTDRRKTARADDLWIRTGTRFEKDE